MLISSRHQSVELLPPMNHRFGIDVGNPKQDSISELFPRLHPNVPQEGSSHFAKRHDKVNVFTVPAMNEGYAPGVDLR
jgi:hypothetical protein